MILVGMGANLMHPVYGEPVNSLKAAQQALEKRGVVIAQRSNWYRTAPVPISNQPWFVNAVLTVETKLDMVDFLSLLHEVEMEFGRVREVRWEARVLDLDLLAFDKQITDNKNQTAGAVVPHPFMQERAFVLAPLNEVAPEWIHPVLGETATQMLTKLTPVQEFEIILN